MEPVENPVGRQTGGKGGDPAVLGPFAALSERREIHRRDFLAGLTATGSLGAVAALPAYVMRTLAGATHPLCSDIQLIATSPPGA